MSAQPAFDADREHRLIEQLELRVANANTDEKFETVVQKFLAALVLKVGSENVRNKNLAIKVCQHINNRLKLDSAIPLPVPSLLKTLGESQSAFVSRFALLFIEQGLDRLQPARRLDILPELLRNSVPDKHNNDALQNKLWSVALDFLLHVLHSWRVPDRGTKEEIELKNVFQLSNDRALLLSQSLTNFISYDLSTGTSWRSISTDFKQVFVKHAKTRSQSIAHIAKFLSTTIFTDDQRFAAAVFLSVDANDAAVSVADVMFKQCDFDLEQETNVDLLFELFDSGRPKLQIRILSLLSRSQNSTNRATKILEIVEQQLFKDSVGLEAAKLRAAVFQYLTWAVRVSKDLSSVKEKLQTTLREYIELQGWPVMLHASVAQMELRAKAYESIGLLATVKSLEDAAQPAISSDLITWLFTSLRCDTTRDVRSSVDEALSRVLNVTSFSSGEDTKRMKDLLLWNVQAQEGDEDPVYHLRTVNNTRYLALRFANKVLAFGDVDARYIDVIALGFNDRREVVEEATRGLDPYWHVTNQKISSGHQIGSTLLFPSFRDFTVRVLGNPGSEHIIRKQSVSLTAATSFAYNLLLHQALKNSPFEVDPDPNWEQQLKSVTSNNEPSRAHLRHYMAGIDVLPLIHLLESSIFGMSLGSTRCADIAFEVASLSSNHVLEQVSSEVLSILSKSCVNNAVQERATRIFGIFMSLSSRADSMITEALTSCSSWSTAIGQEVIAVRGALLCAGYMITRLALRRPSAVATDQVIKVYSLASDIISTSHDISLKHAAYSVVGQICLCLQPSVEWLTELPRLVDSLVADAKKEDEIAVTTLGRILGVTYQTNTSFASELLERLYNLHEVRKAEIHFALGETLTTAALGFRSSSTLSEFDVDATRPDREIQVGLLDQVMDRSIRGVKTTKPSLKKAAAIWLLCIVQYCNEETLLKPHLRDCQTAFAKLLNDRDEIVQETGSRGLGLVYEKGDRALQDDLVRDLVQSFTGSNAKMSGSVDEDTQLFEAGTLPTEGGQSVQTYKDIVNLATEMGDPSLVYRFMNLASNNAIWSSRAAFGRFGLSGVLADSNYLTENKKFYPKLFRYRFDPNPNVQRSMEDIWKALVKDPNQVIEDNFDLIMGDLLKSVVAGKDWRAREASCAAISDLVQGRDIEKFEKYLDEIWAVAFKVLDDVKETVRVAAMKFCRTLTAMLIKNLEVGEGTTKRATTMMQHAIPFLLQQMEASSAQGVQQYAIVTLLEVVKKCPLKTLVSFAPNVLERLLLSLSSLEHESINYLHLNADKYGLTAEKLDKMRVSSISASPVSEAIERCLESLFASTNAESTIDNHVGVGGSNTSNVSDGRISPTDDAMQRLATAFKTTIGLPSKVGLSRVMITLVVRHHAAFRPYADRFLQLTRKSILDRNATISISFSMAVGYLVRLASQKEVNETSRYARKLYFESLELSHRAVAGEIVQSISKASNDVFMRFASTFLPFAFIGRNDLDPDVRDHFDVPWKDNVGGSRALNLYLTEIVELVGTHITSSLWPIRQACCLTVADLVSSMDGVDQYSEADARLLWPVVEESLNGKTWIGKEKVVLAFPKFVKRARPIWPEKGKQIRAMTLREARRSNVAYLPHALTALGNVASACPDLELDQDVLELLTNVWDRLEEQGDDMEVDGGDEQGSSASQVDATLVAIVDCLFQILTVKSRREVLDQVLVMVRRAHGKMSVRLNLEVYDGARRYITQATSRDPSSSDVGGGQAHVPPVGGSHQAENVQHTPREQPVALFLHGLVLAVLGPEESALRYGSDNEALRKSRVSLAQALAESPLLGKPSRKVLIPTLRAYLQGERSRPLKAELEKTIRILET